MCLNQPIAFRLNLPQGGRERISRCRNAAFFGAWVRWAVGTGSGDIIPVLQVQIRQPGAVKQHDLPLGLTEKAKNTLAVES